jgi:hypothetical protein
MYRLYKTVAVLVIFVQNIVNGQSVLNIYPDSLQTSININLTPGVFYVPKTSAAVSDFNGNGIQQNCIRTNAIESVLNNSSNLSGCLSLLSSLKIDLRNLSLKCNKLIFIFEKMPAWLSSSSNSSPATTPGWYVLNTKPPANWNTWQTVVDSITSKIVKEFGITNAYFEIWNEPDLGSWTGTMSEYFTLYKRTYDAIKSATPTAKAGGPAVNFWANNIYWKPPAGYTSNIRADSSLIGQLLDSAVIWNKVPDFVSWHNFNISHQEFAMAANYIRQKTSSLSLPDMVLIVSEWNAPSQIRDTRLASSYMLKAQLSLSKTSIANNAIAAWQDFSPGAVEFHKDYGLLTYGSIHKPAYNSILLSGRLKGTTCKMTSSALYDGISSVLNDTLFILLSNYCPPPFIEALNHTLYQGKLNVNQLDSAGYINIAGNNISRLDSIYRGLIVLPNANAIQVAVSSSISIYQYYNSILTLPRKFNLNIHGHSGNYTASQFIVDSTQNNFQFQYDSLRTAGYTQASAISFILSNQNIKHSALAISAGQYSFALQPNAVCLFKVIIPGLAGNNSVNNSSRNFLVYPNPSSSSFTIKLLSLPVNAETVQIFNLTGVLVKAVYLQAPLTAIHVSELPSGIYFLRLKSNPHKVIKFVKQ